MAAHEEEEEWRSKSSFIFGKVNGADGYVIAQALQEAHI